MTPRSLRRFVEGENCDVSTRERKGGLISSWGYVPLTARPSCDISTPSFPTTSDHVQTFSREH